MIEAIITGDEQKIIEALARLHDKGYTQLMNARETLKKEGLDVNEDEFCRLMRMMKSYGIITDVLSSGVPFFGFTIKSSVVQAWRQIEENRKEEQKPGDVVAQIEHAARRHRVLAWFIIGFIVLTAAVTLANQTAELLERVGVIKSAKQP